MGIIAVFTGYKKARGARSSPPLTFLLFFPTIGTWMKNVFTFRQEEL
jgi:hypothetical protein